MTELERAQAEEVRELSSQAGCSGAAIHAGAVQARQGDGRPGQPLCALQADDDPRAAAPRSARSVLCRPMMVRGGSVTALSQPEPLDWPSAPLCLAQLATGLERMEVLL